LVKKTENLKVENYSASFPLCRAGKQRGVVQGRGFEKVIDNQLLDSYIWKYPAKNITQ
jgi:hypothetical protein